MILTDAVRFAGRGLHTGTDVSVTLLPAAEGEGLKVRLGGEDRHLRDLEVGGGGRATVLLDRISGQALGSVEHLLASLAGLGIWDVLVVPEGEEVPALDGSSAPFARRIAGVAARSAPRPVLRLEEEVGCEGGAGWIRAWPADRLVLDVCIEFAHPCIGRQEFVWEQARGDFVTELAPARTFGFVDEAAELRSRGLARGAGLDCVLVFGPDGVLNPEGQRLRDEPARHKTLDLLGDLALLGRPLAAGVRAHRPSHVLNHGIVEKIRERSKIVVFHGDEGVRSL